MLSLRIFFALCGVILAGTFVVLRSDLRSSGMSVDGKRLNDGELRDGAKEVQTLLAHADSQTPSDISQISTRTTLGNAFKRFAERGAELAQRHDAALASKKIEDALSAKALRSFDSIEAAEDLVNAIERIDVQWIEDRKSLAYDLADTLGHTPSSDRMAQDSARRLDDLLAADRRVLFATRDFLMFATERRPAYDAATNSIRWRAKDLPEAKRLLNEILKRGDELETLGKNIDADAKQAVTDLDKISNP